MAHKGAYVTNLNEFINSTNQRYHHKKYVQQLQQLVKLHQRSRRCLPDPAKGIHSKQAKRPLPTSPCFQKQGIEQTQDSFISPTSYYYSPVSPGYLSNRPILSSPRPRSRNSSRTAIAGSALSNFNTITCFSTSPIPQPTKKELNIPTVIITSEGNQQLCTYSDNKNPHNMAPSSVHHPVNRNTDHMPTTSSQNNNVNNSTTVATNPTSHLRKVTFKLPPSSTNNNGSIEQERTRSAPPLYRSISESSLINCSTISDEQNEMPIQLRNQRNLPAKPLNKHPMSPTLPIAKLRLLKELNSSDNKSQQNCLSRNSTMYNLNNMNNYNTNTGIWPQRNTVFDPRYQQLTNQYGPVQQQTGPSKYSNSLPNSPSRSMYNQMYNQHFNQQFNQRHLSSVPNYQPVDCYTVGANGMLSSHGSRFPLGSIPPINATTSPHSPQTNLLPTYSQITKPPFLDGQYSHRTGMYNYNPILYDKTLQRLKQRIPVCKSAPLSSIIANSLPTTNQFTTHDSISGLPRRRHTSATLTKSNLSPKTNLGTGQRNPTILTDGTIEQEDSPLTQMRKEIKYFVDERKRQLEGPLDINNLNIPNTTFSGNSTGKYLGSNSNLSNSTAIFNDQSPIGQTGAFLNQQSPNLTSTLAQNRTNYLSSSESDLNALLNMYSYPPDPVLERTPPAGASIYQRLPQFYLNSSRSKNRYTVDDLRRRRHPLLDYYDENLYNQYYSDNYYDPLLFDRNYPNQLPTSTYHSLIDWPSSYGNRPGYYASTGSLRTSHTPTLTNLNTTAGLNLLNYNRNLIGGANNTYNNSLYYDQDLMIDNYLPNDYHSLDTLGLDHRTTSYSRPNSPYYSKYQSAVTNPDHYTHSLSTNHLDTIDLNNNLLTKSLGQTSTLPLRSYRL